MKRALYALVIFLLVLPAFVCAAENTPRMLSVSADAEIKVVPDEVFITLGVETSNRVLAQAKKENDDAVRDIIALVKKLRIDSKYVQTDYFTVEPRYEYKFDSRENRDKYQFVGYFVRKNISITLKDLSKYEDVVSGVLEAGANYVHGIQFRTTELRKHRDAARVLAVKAARDKADLFARELGVRVRGVISLNEDYGGWWSWYNNAPWGRANASQNISQNAMGYGGGQPPEGGDTLAPGQISVTARVTVTFEID